MKLPQAASLFCWLLLFVGVPTCFADLTHEISIVAIDGEAMENMANSAEIEISISPATGYSVNVILSVTGTAITGSDYNPLGTTLSGSQIRVSVPADGSLPLFLNPIENEDSEGDRTVNISISSIEDTSLPISIGQNNSVSLTIIDDETVESPDYGSVVMIGYAQPNAVTYSWKTGEPQGCGGSYSNWEPEVNWQWSGDCSDEDLKIFNRSCLNDQTSTKRRDVWCERSDGANMGSSATECDINTRPEDTVPCTMACVGETEATTGEACYTYAWHYNGWSPCYGSYSDWNSWSSWSTCSKNCDGGTQTRTRTCKNNANGYQTRTVVCKATSLVDGETYTVDDSFCGAGRPADTQACVRGCSGSSSETQACNTQSCATCTTKGPGWWVIPANGVYYGCSSGITTSPFNDCNQFQPTTTTYCFQVCRDMKIEACSYIDGRCRNYKNNYGYNGYNASFTDRYLQTCTFQTP